MRIAFLGLGLVGGSVARAVRAADPAAELVAWTPAGQGPAAAVAAGVLDGAAPSLAAAADGADLVVLAAPPRACLALLADLAPHRARLAPGATVTDVASTKASLHAIAAAAGLPYVGGHPMAGRETSGYGAGDGSLFAGRPWVVGPPVGGGDPAAVRALAVACGARPVELEPGLHDRLVAAISHLPLVAAVALVEAVAGDAPGAAPEWSAASGLAASGWRDTTRLARGDATMGAEILATNAPEVAARLRALRDRLDEWVALLEDPGVPDAAMLRARLESARERLEG